MTRAIFPGTFDPLTNGHCDLIERAAQIFTELWIGVASNPAKKPLLPLAERLALCETVCRRFSNVKIVTVTGLLVAYAQQQKINLIIRGLRTSHDFEYEFQLAGMNRSMWGELETVFLTPHENTLFISSTLVKEILVYGGDITTFVPEAVATHLEGYRGVAHH